MLRLGARRHVHKASIAPDSDTRPTTQKIHHALVATQFCDTVYNSTTNTVCAKNKEEAADLPSISVPLHDNVLTLRFPECTRKAVCGPKLKEDVEKLLEGTSADNILQIAEKLCAWIIWLIHEYLGDAGPKLKQHKEGRYLKFST
jgi:hypothetical protein